METAHTESVPHTSIIQEIERANRVLPGVVHVTPLLRSLTFSRMTGAQVYLKAENLQRAGSYGQTRKAFSSWSHQSRAYLSRFARP